MNIAGIVKSSFIDYPGCAAIVIFLGGCNFRCGYCHNPEIVRGGEGEITLADFFAFLEKRRKFVDAVCISGGEPTIHAELYNLIQKVRQIGYKVKLDTNGTNPQLIRRLISEELVNHIAMDIKGSWEKYGQIAGCADERSTVECVKESLAILKESSGEPSFTYELRTTVCRELLNKADILLMARQLAGAQVWYLQTFKKQGELLDETVRYSAYTPEEMEKLRAAAAELGTMERIAVR